MKNIHFEHALVTCIVAGSVAGCGGTGTSLSPSLNGHFGSVTTSALRQAHPNDGFELLYMFGNVKGGGRNPRGGVTFADNSLIGTTYLGGDHDSGTVFRFTEVRSESVLHGFGGPGDGARPFATLVNVKGALYGTTERGGANNAGTVFVILPFGAGERVLHSFGGLGEGAHPKSGLLNVKGTLYGTTNSGGANNVGTVYSITTSGAETVLHSFGGAGDGANPAAGLIDVRGTLYSTTTFGGAHNRGTIYAIATSGTETVLHSFGGSEGDGTYPYAGLVFTNDNMLIGTTLGGGQTNGGTIFALPSFGKERILHSFGSAGDGSGPYAGLLAVGDFLYGTTAYGGSAGKGTIFSVHPRGEERVLHNFTGRDGSSPYAGLTFHRNRLYGTADFGGDFDKGTIFALTLPTPSPPPSPSPAPAK